VEQGKGLLRDKDEKNASYVITERRSVPENSSVLKDEIIRLADIETWEKYPLPLRRIVVWGDKNKTEIVLLTDHLRSRSTTISSIYKERWQIAVFFKTSAAEPQGQDLYRSERECPSHPDLDSSCSSTDDQVAAL
jgi:hypothetical protein